jgi:hypothetical protein
MYIRMAIENLTLAVAAKPDDALRHLTLGCAYEDGLTVATAMANSRSTAMSTKATNAPPVVTATSPEISPSPMWKDLAAKEYLHSFDLGFANGKPVEQSVAVSEEAGKDYLKIVAKDMKLAADLASLIRVKRGVARLESLPRMVTPIIFSLHKNAALAAATHSTHNVSFDLDGTSRPQRYSWLKPDTGILVWDPDGTGQITSGRQLFGSVTWWIFWKDGYQAIDALDDNRDGRLSGSELKGIGVWFDRNSDGVCEPGEVVRATSLGIKSISCRSTGVEDGALSSRAGVEMQNGDTFKSCDWVAMSTISPSTSAVPHPHRQTTRGNQSR